jgi:hypothetical protein
MIRLRGSKWRHIRSQRQEELKMKTKQEIRQHLDDLLTCSKMPCSCAGTEHEARCIIGGRMMEATINTIQWILGENNGLQNMVNRMSSAEYRAAVVGCAFIAKMLTQYDLQAIIEAINHSDAFGCFIDPTLWINNRDKMQEDKQIIEAAMPLWKMGMKMKTMAEETRDADSPR